MAKEEYGEVKFFGSGGSPYARRVQIALKLNGVKYQHFEEDIRNKSELLLKYNPIHKKVPVLVHNDKPIAESLVLPAIQEVVWTVEVEKREKAIEEASEALRYLEKELKGKFFGGERIGMVDIAAAYIAFWLPLTEEAVGLKLLTHDKFPKLYKWSQEFCSHPVVRENLPPPSRLLGFFKARYASITASK
ncbi:hypothetical protein K1719_044198 [Acacia pycnantha]|nr:hypothetical protein K1719_044198 [Acacia pycnantha]